MKAITHPDTRRARTRSLRRGGDIGALQLGLALLGIVGFPALALATHSTPGPGLTNAWNRLEAVTLVPAHMTCGVFATTTHNPPLALPACTSPTPASALRLGPSAPIGRGRMRIRKIGPVNAPDVLVAAQMFDIRMSDHGCIGGVPCTVVDFSLPFPVSCAAGACIMTTMMNTALPWRP